MSCLLLLCGWKKEKNSELLGIVIGRGKISWVVEYRIIEVGG